MKTASWVICNKETGEAIMETAQRSILSKLPTDKYEAVPILEYLAGLNRAPAKRQFIGSREVLIAVFAHQTGFFLAETKVIGKTYATASEAMACHQNDDTTRFIRFDMDTLTGEDVTEEMATAYLEDSNLTPHDEDQLSTFVRTSEAWETFCKAEGVAYTQASHGTLNHQSQGISR